MSEYIQVATTTQTEEEARRIAAAVVEKRLAACAQIFGPIQSTYWWKGKLESATEWLCLMKTRRERYDAIEKAVRELHSYEEPEIIATPISGGSPGYLVWLDREIRFGEEP